MSHAEECLSRAILLEGFKRFFQFFKDCLSRIGGRMRGNMRIGIDIGGMSIKLGIVNDQQQIVDKMVIETNSKENTQTEIAETIAQAVCTLAEKNGLELSECSCVGVACPGTVDPATGVVLYSNNLEWENLPLLDIMKKYISAPMAIANDADAAALGEVQCGAAKGKENAILLTLGTGVGGGVILGGKIFTGYLRGGCELGHMVIQQGGKLCTCGRKGCLEQYASATALMEQAREALKANPDSLMGELCGQDAATLNGKMIFDAQKQGDAAAVGVVEAYEEYLSIGIANLINIFRPEVVILGGGVSAQKEYLTDALQKKVNDMCFGGAHGQVAPIVTSELGNDAGIIGAAYLC